MIHRRPTSEAARFRDGSRATFSTVWSSLLFVRAIRNASRSPSSKSTNTGSGSAISSNSRQRKPVDRAVTNTRVITMKPKDRKKLRTWIGVNLPEDRSDREGRRSRTGGAAYGPPAIESLKAMIERKMQPAFKDDRGFAWCERGTRLKKSELAELCCTREAYEIIRASPTSRTAEGEDDRDSGVQPKAMRLLRTAAAEIIELPRTKSTAISDRDRRPPPRRRRKSVIC